MKKIIPFCVVCLFLWTNFSTPGFAQTTKDILDKMIEAQGGRAALAKIQDATMSGTMEIISMGLSGTMTYYIKEPNKMRMDMEFMGMVVTQAFDGEMAWGVDPNTGSSQEMPADQSKEMKKMALGYGALLTPEKYGITYTYKGKKAIEDKDYHVLEQSFEDGSIATMYIDSETYLVYRVDSRAPNQMGMEADQEVISSNYKKVDGIVVALETRIIQDGEEVFIMSFTDVAFNTGLEDSLFTMEE